MPLMREVIGGVTFAVRVQPGAKRAANIGAYGEAVKIAVAAPADDGKANEALVQFLASLLNVPRMSVEILSGALSRSKVVRVMGVSSTATQERLSGSELS